MQVELSNILEKVVNCLRSNAVSYIFLKPVTKKDAPDYLDIIVHRSANGPWYHQGEGKEDGIQKQEGFQA